MSKFHIAWASLIACSPLVLLLYEPPREHWPDMFGKHVFATMVTLGMALAVAAWGLFNEKQHGKRLVGLTIGVGVIYLLIFGYQLAF